jgi:CheY-like chemotaxis protein
MEERLAQAHKMEAVGQLTGGVAHDFNNLLTVVLGNIDIMARRSEDGDKRALRIDAIRQAAERGRDLTRQLLAFSRRQNLTPVTVDIRRLVEEFTPLLRQAVGEAVTVALELGDEPLCAHIDVPQMEAALLNLAVNARDAMPGGGTLTISAGLTRGPDPSGLPAGSICLAVADTGSGMSPEVLERVFEPFFTTKEVGKGSGLGLSQVLGFAKQSGGGMCIETQVGVGTSVRVYLPRAAKHDFAGAVAEQGGSGEPPRKGATVLLVDDDSAVREVTASILREIGYVVLEVGSGGAALELLDAQTHIDLALLDYAMPGMNGMDVASQLNAKLPALPILFVTGYADKAALGDLGDARIIKKPFIGNELAEKVHAALVAAPRVSGKVLSFKR